MACGIIFWNNIKRKSDAWTPCGCESCKTVWRIQRSSRCQLYFCDFHKCLYASVGICRHLGGIFFRWDVLQLFCYSEVLSWFYSGLRCHVLREHETAETDENVSLCFVRIEARCYGIAVYKLPSLLVYRVLYFQMVYRIAYVNIALLFKTWLLLNFEKMRLVKIDSNRM